MAKNSSEASCEDEYNGEYMALRTIYLPPRMDERLRVLAFKSKLTKNELIRVSLMRELCGCKKCKKKWADLKSLMK